MNNYGSMRRCCTRLGNMQQDEVAAHRMTSAMVCTSSPHVVTSSFTPARMRGAPPPRVPNCKLSSQQHGGISAARRANMLAWRNPGTG